MKYHTVIEKLSQELVREDQLELLLRERAIRLAADLLRQGELVAFPTETVYGLGADATRSEAVAQIFLAKGRPQDNPLIVHIAREEQLKQIIAGPLPPLAEKLIKTFWPGPLTIIVNKNEAIPPVITAGLDSVAVRMPAHPVARALITAAGIPLAAPSANLSGTPSPTLATHVWTDLQGRIPLIIDGGPARIGIESTVVDLRAQTPLILRPGGLSRERLEAVLGIELEVAAEITAEEEKPLSPGMKYRHYSPATPLLLNNFDRAEQLAEISEQYRDKRIALVVTAETARWLEHLANNFKVVVMGSRSSPAGIAANLFAILRELDHLKLDKIIVEMIPETGIGMAVMNRLHRASKVE